MPYISEELRWMLSEGKQIDTAGELQYVIAVKIKEFLGKEYRYQDLNDVMGALAGAQQEFYRKVVAPYEQKKEEESGGVY